MAPPSKLAVATGAVQRLVKEEASYHKELEQQQTRIKKLEGVGGDNAEYELKQERQALEETRAVLPSLQSRIKEALAKLEEQLELNKDAGGMGSVEEVTKAKEAVANAKKSIVETA
ncbi:putative tubulin-specific chaperone Rbl2 [Saccharata proteae CBS 121410]|uniref:Tubulin-specific chaperone A n=1 Tax=Saccharata proteae CBS 121410 TaxID=1314787 RepID=A0A9P4LWD3_9PEZI|nr:putative tubulin-specific chaperone Rbl2 [Saccharata proteae CBS 121410]